MTAYYFAEITGSLFYGFGIVAAIYLIVIFIFILLFKNYISVKVMDMVTNIFFDPNEQSESDDEEL
jgi:hypothetical protein